MQTNRETERSRMGELLETSQIAYYSYDKDEYGWWGLTVHLIDGSTLPSASSIVSMTSRGGLRQSANLHAG